MGASILSLPKDVLLHIMKHYLLPRDCLRFAASNSLFYSLYPHHLRPYMIVNMGWEETENALKSAQEIVFACLAITPKPKYAETREYIQCKRCGTYLTPKKYGDHVNRRKCQAIVPAACSKCKLFAHCFPDRCAFDQAMCIYCYRMGPRNIVERRLKNYTYICNICNGPIGAPTSMGQGCTRCGVRHVQRRCNGCGLQECVFNYPKKHLCQSADAHLILKGYSRVAGRPREYMLHDDHALVIDNLYDIPCVGNSNITRVIYNCHEMEHPTVLERPQSGLDFKMDIDLCETIPMCKMCYTTSKFVMSQGQEFCSGVCEGKYRAGE
jgi:hypothetical protein